MKNGKSNSACGVVIPTGLHPFYSQDMVVGEGVVFERSIFKINCRTSHQKRRPSSASSSGAFEPSSPL